MQVAPGAPHPPIEQLVAGAHLGGLLHQSLDGRPPARQHVGERQRPGSGLAGGAGARDDGDLRALLGSQGHAILRPVLAEPGGRRLKGQGRDAHASVETPVGQVHLACRDRRGQQGSPALAGMAAHLEHVGEVGGEAHGERQLVSLAGEALDPGQLVQGVVEDAQPACDAHRPARQDEALADGHVGIGQLHRGLQRVLRHVRLEDERPLGEYPEIQAAQKARAPGIEAQLGARQIGQIAVEVRDHEGVVVLEDELGQIGGDAGGEDVVIVAGRHIPGNRLAHAAAALVSRRRYTAS
jgi:hypothetical protein